MTLLSISIFIIVTLPVSLIIETGVVAIYWALVLGGIFSTIAGMLHILTNINISTLWLILETICILVVSINSTLRNRLVTNARNFWKSKSNLFTSILSLAVVVVLAGVGPASAWDARSIWLLHAKWLTMDAKIYRNAFTDNFLEWTHTSYPIAIPSANAVIWELVGGFPDLNAGVFVTALLGCSVVVICSVTLFNFMAASNAMFRYLVSILALLALLNLSRGWINNGYVDVLQAASIATIALLVYSQTEVQNHSHRDIKLYVQTLVMLTFAVNIKQEGFYFVLPIAIGYLLWLYRYSRRVKLMLGVIATGTTWLVWKFSIIRGNALSDSDASGIFSSINKVTNSKSLEALAAQKAFIFMSNYFATTLFIILILATWLILTQKAKVVNLIMFFLIPISMQIFTLFVTYVFGKAKMNIDFFLDTSVFRNSSTPVAMIIVFLSITAALALGSKVEASSLLKRNTH